VKTIAELSLFVYDIFMLKLIRAASLSLFVFGLLGWFYIAVNAWVHPSTLSRPLSHLTLWIREDTFGAICFIVAFLSFFVWIFTKQSKN
jgi:hypothetical protein